MINTRMRKLCLKKIRGADNSWVEDNKDVAVKAIKFFETQLSKKNVQRDPNILNCIPRVINNEDNDLLEANPTMEEVKDAFFSLSADSAPGPDGISGKFYHHCWDIISADLFDMVCHYFAGTDLPRSITHTCFILLLKVNSPQRGLLG